MNEDATTHASPRPWRVADCAQCPGLADVFDASGSPSGLVAGELKPADAALIVDAVNYYRPDLHCDWRELTPDDAVAHCRDVAARLGDTPCARDHLQLAAWIEERDRLRDIVKRMADKLEVHRGIFTASGVWSETGCHETCSLIREARAAIGEDKP